MPTTQTTTLATFVTPNYPIAGENVTILTRVISSDGGVVSGNVTFSSTLTTSTIHGSSPIIDNECIFTIDTSYFATNILGGSINFIATYNGDSTYSGNSSTSSVNFTSYAAANSVWIANSSTSGGFDYTKQLTYIASSLRTIAVNSSEIRNYIGDISKSLSSVQAIANLASGNGIHTTGAYDWLGAVSLVKYYVEQGAILETGGNISATQQLIANSTLKAYANSLSTNSVIQYKKF